MGSFLIAVCLLAGSISTRADDQKSTSERKTAVSASVATDSVRTSSGTPLSAQQETAALKFAREHHPELAELLERLQTHSTSGFQKAIREVHSTVQRLDRLQERQPERYISELQDWKLSSEIRLLTARWVMSQDPELEQQIRELMKQRRTARMDRLKMEREKLTERLASLDSQIEAAEAEVADNMTKEWDRLARQAQGMPRPKVTSGSSPKETKARSR